MVDLRTSKIVSEYGDCCFPQIRGNRCSLSFLASVRYLLADKEVKDGLNIISEGIMNEETNLEERTDTWGRTTIQIYGCEHKEFLASVAAPFRFKRMDVLEKFMCQKGLHASLFINAIEQRVIIIAENREMQRIMLYMQSLIPYLIPWYFHTKNSKPDLSSRDREFIEAVSQDTPEARQTCFEAIGELLNSEWCKDKWVGHLCKGVGDTIIESRIKAMENANAVSKREIDNYIAAIETHRRNIDENNYVIIGLKQSREKYEAQTFISLFSSMKNVELQSVSDGCISMLVKTTSSVNPDNYDMVASLLDNDHAECYRDMEHEEMEDFKFLMENIFCEDADIGIKTYSYSRINLQGGTGSCISSYTGEETEILRNNYLPHPHIQQYSCYGTGVTAVAQFLMQGDIFSAIQQTVECSNTINPSESNIFYIFIRNAFTCSKKVFLTRDGNSLDSKEAVQWLNNQQEKGGQTQ